MPYSLFYYGSFFFKCRVVLTGIFWFCFCSYCCLRFFYYYYGYLPICQMRTDTVVWLDKLEEEVYCNEQMVSRLIKSHQSDWNFARYGTYKKKIHLTAGSENDSVTDERVRFIRTTCRTAKLRIHSPLSTGSTPIAPCMSAVVPDLLITTRLKQPP